MVKQENKKIEIIGFTPYEKQVPVLKALLDKKTKHIIYNASRQSGKTLLSINFCIKTVLDYPGIQIMFISKTDAMIKKIYKQLLESIIHIPIIKSYKIQSGDSEIIFYNGSKVRFRSAAAGDTLRGYTSDVLILDEFAHYKDLEYIYNIILKPQISSKSSFPKKVLICSTPLGKNLFFTLYHKGLQQGQDIYKSFRITYLDNPYADKKQIEEDKQTMLKEAFEQEYMGEFVDSSNIFKNVEELAVINRQEPNSSSNYFCGIDIAFRTDWTVISIFNDKGEMVFYDRFNNMETSALIDRLVQTIKKWNIRKGYIESNNQGLPVFDGLRNKGCWQLELFDTTSKSKPQIINNLIYAFNKKEIKILNDEMVKNEFKAFGFEIGKGGHIKFRASYGNDDIVMASAIGWECMNKNRYSGQFVFI